MGQEVDLKAGKPTKESGKVLPREDVEIYATDGHKGGHLGPAGTKHTVHRVLAEKLVKAGHAVMEKGDAKKKGADKPVTLTKAEVTKLEKELGYAPTEEDIAAAIEAKKGGSK